LPNCVRTSNGCRRDAAAGSSTPGYAELPLQFDGRIVLVGGAVADEWGRLVARQAARGRPIQAMDGLIAATAQVHGLTLVTRNVTDFHTAVKTVLNPWT
jgi:toxin FitB